MILSQNARKSGNVFHRAIININIGLKKITCVLLGFIVIILCAHTHSLNQSTSEPGMEAIDTPDYDLLLIGERFDLPLSRKIYIDELQFDFSAAWLLEFNSRIPTTYKKRISHSYGQRLIKIFKKELVNFGWEIMDKADASTVVVRPRIFDLYVSAPDTVGITHTIVKRIGTAGIELTFSTPTGQPFIKIIDHRMTANKSSLFANRAINYRYFGKLMDIWSTSSVQYLERIMEFAKNQQAQPTPQ